MSIFFDQSFLTGLMPTFTALSLDAVPRELTTKVRIAVFNTTSRTAVLTYAMHRVGLPTERALSRARSKKDVSKRTPDGMSRACVCLLARWVSSRFVGRIMRGRKMRATARRSRPRVVASSVTHRRGRSRVTRPLTHVCVRNYTCVRTCGRKILTRIRNTGPRRRSKRDLRRSLVGMRQNEIRLIALCVSRLNCAPRIWWYFRLTRHTDWRPRRHS